MEQGIATPSRDDLLAVATLADRFVAPDFVAGEWVTPPPGEDRLPQIGYWAPSEDVMRWQAALYEHQIIVPFDWTAPEWKRQMRRYEGDPSRLDQAKLLTIRKVITTLVRAERFCEGSLAVEFRQGVPQAAMRRLEQLSKRMN